MDEPQDSHHSSWSQTHPNLYIILSPGSRPQPGLGAASSLYLEGIRGIVDVRDLHITPVLRAAAVGITQLEGLRL